MRQKRDTERSLARRVPAAALLPAAMLSLATPTALAAPLDPEACTALKTEHTSLVAAGAKSDMSRGPEWAKTNLAPDRLDKIKRLIAVEEQLSFRCGEQLTARPQIKELPKPAGVASSIPPPIRKDVKAALAAKNRQAGQR
ncbi:hypothetical protein [Hyphomicrobium sp. CS1GBMeth3]|uniref:hypothetical protein n=1 Tax=Hyphomicrobium sp. CS1GBMeth3 TaxID=1892845 RepID=UPI0015C56B06|nr:hypothetical protein [Hyphomicrobium sp. CS1GBMeth3]